MLCLHPSICTPRTSKIGSETLSHPIESHYIALHRVSSVVIHLSIYLPAHLSIAPVKATCLSRRTTITIITARLIITITRRRRQ